MPYTTYFGWVLTLPISVTYWLNRSGPRILPWGTPVLVVFRGDMLPLSTHTACGAAGRKSIARVVYLWFQNYEVFLEVYHNLTLNAFKKPMYTLTTNCFLSNEPRIISFCIKRDSSVDPYWHLFTKSNLFVKLEILVYHNFSSPSEDTGSIESLTIFAVHAQPPSCTSKSRYLGAALIVVKRIQSFTCVESSECFEPISGG